MKYTPLTPQQWKQVKDGQVSDWLEWLLYDHGKTWGVAISNWARLEVWKTEVPDEWAWKVGLGGTQGMAVVSVAPSEREAKLAAEAYMFDLLTNAIGKDRLRQICRDCRESKP